MVAIAAATARMKHYRPKQYLTQRTSAGAAPQRLKAWRVKLKNKPERQTKIRGTESGQKEKSEHFLSGREGSVV